MRISANHFSKLPNELFELPNLSWLAFAGNPLSDLAGGSTTIRQISWHALQLKQILGEGASGIIYQADWQTDKGKLAVAVKLFKGTMTSDGLPRHEMAACLQAGEHPNLISVLGQIIDHPNHDQGLVLSLIDPQFINLAEPPSLESCTRDRYSPNQQFSLPPLLKIILSIATAANHLHTNGVMHGDLYAHNIMLRNDGLALLGDFGAATLFTTSDQIFSEKLQRLEVLAFSRLLEELLARCIFRSDHDSTIETLQTLQARCANSTPAARPLFAEITHVIQDIL